MFNESVPPVPLNSYLVPSHLEKKRKEEVQNTAYRITHFMKLKILNPKNKREKGRD